MADEHLTSDAEIDLSDLISYEEAAEKYGVSVRWLQTQKSLTVAKLPSDRKHYVLRSEVEKLTRPKIIRSAKDD
jgi:hypothetical protein